MKLLLHGIKLLTKTSRCITTPHSIRLTHSSSISSEIVTRVTGVGGCFHEGGSRGCVHCSISRVRKDSTINSYQKMRIKVKYIPTQPTATVSSCYNFISQSGTVTQKSLAFTDYISLIIIIILFIQL